MSEQSSTPRLLPYEFHPDAEREFVEDASYIRQESPRAAQAFEAEVFRAIALVQRYPEIGPAIGPTKAVRKKRLTKQRLRYNIVYAVEPELIWILAVAHHSRRPGYWAYRLKDLAPT